MSASVSISASSSTSDSVSLNVAAFASASVSASLSISASASTSLRVWQCLSALACGRVLASVLTSASASTSPRSLERSSAFLLIECQPTYRPVPQPLHQLCGQESRPSTLLARQVACLLVSWCPHRPVCCSVSWLLFLACWPICIDFRHYYTVRRRVDQGLGLHIDQFVAKCLGLLLCYSVSQRVD